MCKTSGVARLRYYSAASSAAVENRHHSCEIGGVESPSFNFRNLKVKEGTPYSAQGERPGQEKKTKNKKRRTLRGDGGNLKTNVAEEELPNTSDWKAEEADEDKKDKAIEQDKDREDTEDSEDEAHTKYDEDEKDTEDTEDAEEEEEPGGGG